MNTSTNQTKPSDVSTLIAQRHRALEETLIELSRVAATLEAGGPGALAHARKLSSRLCEELLDHIAIVDAILVPTLRGMDAWGAGRADNLVGRLGMRRQEIGAFQRFHVTSEGLLLGEGIDRFIDRRRNAMERVVVCDLSALRDDVVGIDCNGG